MFSALSDINEWSLNYFESQKEQCNAYLSNLQDWSSIPTINRELMDNLTDGSVVRYVGMIQDVLNPEYFFTNYHVREKEAGKVINRSGYYRDLLVCADNEELLNDELEMNKQDSRYPLFCIPVPGINNWAEQRSKVSHGPIDVRPSGSKRPYSDLDVEMVEEKTVRRKTEVEPTVQNTSDVAQGDVDYEKYFPLPVRGGLACIVKHYGEHEDWLVNTKVEVVGFLSVSPELEASWQECDAEDRAMHPPPSRVPRLHALQIRKLIHCNPLLPTPSVKEELDFSLIRSDILTTFTQLLYGDTLAAEYLLYNLLSSVYARRDGLAIGALSLNLYNIHHTPAYAKQLFEFMQALLPTSSYLPLDIDLLNTSSFIPRKNYNSNRLWSGRLQLADDTHLFIDETTMTEGRLVESGLRNMAALHSLTLRQSLRYDFTYFQLDFDTNIPTIVLSEGKSLIPTNVVVKVIPEACTASTMTETFAAANYFMSGDRLDATRKYLTILRLREFRMDDANFVGPAWADLRQNHPKLQQDDLHNMLVLSKLIAASEGQSNITKAGWDKAVAMEKARREHNA